jgi:hypothetical protein
MCFSDEYVNEKTVRVCDRKSLCDLLLAKKNLPVVSQD